MEGIKKSQKRRLYIVASIQRKVKLLEHLIPDTSLSRIRKIFSINKPLENYSYRKLTGINGHLGSFLKDIKNEAAR